MSDEPQAAPRTGPTLDHVYLAAALALLALRPLLTPIQPHDFWWHMATGRVIAAEWRVPQVDLFSYTRAGEPFFNQSWLAQLLMFGLHQAGGPELLVVAQALLIAASYGLLLRLCVLRSGRLRMSVALLLVSLPLSFDNWTIRPQSYVFPLFVGCLTVLTEWRLGGARRLWLLPILLALWVNMHGSFVLGLALIGITAAGEVLRMRRSPAQWPAALGPLLGWGTLAGLATLLNPQGPAVWGYVANLLRSSQVTTLVTEWAPPTIRDTGGAIFFAFLAFAALVLIYARERPDPTDMLLLGAFLYLALGAGRNIVWLGFVALPPLAAALATLLPPAREPGRGSPTFNAALIAMLALLLVVGSPWLKPALLPPSVGALLAADTPVAATEALRSLPNRPQRLFHASPYGSYLTWAAPEQRVFIDPRIELYPYDQWLDYIALGQASDVERISARYQFDGMLLSKVEQARLVAAARADARWRLVYEDATSVLLVR